MANGGRRQVAALAVVVAGLVTACSQGLGDASLDSWPSGSGPVPAAHQRPVQARTGSPDDGAGGAHLASTEDGCRDLALGPWAQVAYRTDPLALVRSGRLPLPTQGGEVGRADDVREFATVEDYRDHSTYEDPGAIHEAMQRGGFVAGAEAVWGSGLHLSAITVVRYRDAAAARDVLTAQLDDYCRRATTATVLEDENGLSVYRRSGASRAMLVLDDTVVSVFTCGCSGANAGEWSSRVTEQIQTGRNHSTS